MCKNRFYSSSETVSIFRRSRREITWMVYCAGATRRNHRSRLGGGDDVWRPHLTSSRSGEFVFKFSTLNSTILRSIYSETNQKVAQKFLLVISAFHRHCFSFSAVSLQSWQNHLEMRCSRALQATLHRWEFFWSAWFSADFNGDGRVWKSVCLSVMILSRRNTRSRQLV